MVEYTFSLDNFEIFLLILVRVSCFVFIAPFFGMANVPGRLKVGLAVCIALLINGFVDTSHVGYTGMLGYAVIVLKEGITGLQEILLIWILVCPWHRNLIRLIIHR